MDKYLDALKQRILNYIAAQPVKVYLIGSRARGDARKTSDVDIALLPIQPLPDSFIIQLREMLEESTIPYTVDIIDLSKLNDEQKQHFLKKAIVWKD